MYTNDFRKESIKRPSSPNLNSTRNERSTQDDPELGHPSPCTSVSSRFGSNPVSNEPVESLLEQHSNPTVANREGTNANYHGEAMYTVDPSDDEEPH
jgi:hypothetical protein